jgi:hypothetical protein
VKFDDGVFTVAVRGFLSSWAATRATDNASTLDPQDAR